MALAALISAYHESGEAGHLRATLPLAGRTVIERQARLAASAGANPVVIFVERLPAALSAAIERLRRDRVPVKLVRSAEEAAEAIDPFDRVLLVGDGAIVAAAQQRPPRRREGAGGADRAGRRAWRAVRADRRPVALGRPRRDRRRAAARDRGHAARLGPAIDPAPAHAPGRRGPCRGGQRRVGRDPRPRRRIWTSWSGGSSPAPTPPIAAGPIICSAPIERLVTLMLVGSPLSPQLIGLAAALLTGLGRRGFLCRLVLDRPDQTARRDAARRHRRPARAAAHAERRPARAGGPI